MQVCPNRFRIPDVCVLRSTDPKDRVVRFATLLCIEVLSSADTMRDMHERAADYFGLGVEHMWAVDPWKRLGFAAVQGDLVPPGMVSSAFPE